MISLNPNLKSFGGPRKLVIRILLVLIAVSPSVQAYTPTDPVVTKMVDRGLEYLEKLTDNDLPGDAGSFSGSSGVAVLVAYASQMPP